MFTALPLDRRLLMALDTMGLSEPTAVQRATLAHTMAGRDVMIAAQTGSGKTLAYLLPAITAALGGVEARRAGLQALVLVPTRELAHQVVREGRRLAAKVPVALQVITGGEAFNYQAAALRKDPALVVATPGRMLEHCQRGSVELSSLRLLVLDEADLMLDLGLRAEVLALNRFAAADKQVLLVSATLEGDGVAKVADELLRKPEIVSIGRSAEPADAIAHQQMQTGSRAHKDQLLGALLSSGDYRSALVFANKRTVVVRVAALLAAAGRRCACLHGQMSMEERRAVVNQFRSGQVNVLCATDLAARGLDVPHVDLVINYQVPHSADDYVHRSGRTGRAGVSGRAVTLVERDDEPRMAAIARQLRLPFAPCSSASSGRARGKHGENKVKSGHAQSKRVARRRASSANNDGFGPLMKRDS